MLHLLAEDVEANSLGDGSALADGNDPDELSKNFPLEMSVPHGGNSNQKRSIDRMSAQVIED